MLAFRVLINGDPVCTASSDSVVSVVSTLKGAATEGGAAPPDLHVAGMTDTNTYAQWAQQPLAAGDSVTIEVIEVSAGEVSEPIEVQAECADLVEAQRRAYYETLKAEYEPEAPTSAQ